ncbi:MAG: hypothetical protein COV76_04225 [Candidatus Omnitrophica bacterium CG11_big_fil_rev_8_21_14_0_20_64_10]|nr:MAG: hypothetical protein COV76_04225 [Candidatus Omnitrophica bacterium CG11_big_fil_rev_8_21_14_0_20_64_10]
MKRTPTGSLAGQICLVTGAGKGIGRTAALELLRCGARVAAVSRTAADLRSLEREAEAGERLLTLRADLARPGTPARIVARTVRRFGGLDVLVNNAGIRFRKAALKISDAEWNRVIQNNLTAPFACAREAAAVMIRSRKGGRIVNVSSIIGTIGLPELAAYGAAKGGLVGMTRSLATEWAPNGIRVNAVAPGFCETSYAPAFRKKRALYRMTLDRTPMGRWGKASEAADAILFLASDAVSYLTGQVLHVDGGWCAW